MDRFLQIFRHFWKYFINVMIAFDQLVNTLFGGYPDETLSSRAYRCRDKRRWFIVINIINALFFNRHHCFESFQKDVDLPKEYKNSFDKRYD